MENIGISLLIVFLTILAEVESKYCPYPNDRNLRITCHSYEYCCSKGCCRSTLTFYQLWYFWLSVILLLLLCSGGGWWYRFKYRTTIYSQQTGATGTNAFYYPSTDRVFLQNMYKDNRGLQRPYGSPAQPAQQQYPCGPPPPGFTYPQSQPYPPPQQPTTYPTQQHPNTYPTQQHPSYPPFQQQAPPPYTGPPPSYDTVLLHQGKG